MLRLNPKQILIGTAIAGLNAAALTLPMVAFGDTQTPTTTINLAVNAVLSAYSSGPTVTLGALTPDATGKESVNSDTVSATSNDAAGVTITLQESGGSTSMTSGANNITASAGTTAAPIALVNGTWGWRIDSLAGFGAGPTSTLSNVAPAAATFAAIPASGSPFTIKTTAASGSTSSTVWYGARANNTQASGTYSTTVTYTITTN